MSTLSMGNHSVDDEQLNVEQARLEALLQLTTNHKKELQALQSQLESTERKAAKLEGQIKTLEIELKPHRATNPDRMKKQIKRLQEQNRTLSVENTAYKTKQKQLQQQLQTTKVELEKLRTEQEEKEKNNESKTDDNKKKKPTTLKEKVES